MSTSMQQPWQVPALRRLSALANHCGCAVSPRATVEPNFCSITATAPEWEDPKEVISRERAGSSFSARQLAYLLEGEEGTHYLELASLIVERDDILNCDENVNDLAVPEQRARYNVS